MLYQSVYENLRDAIRGGEYPVGERLPPEAALLEEHSVSAITLRRALDMLRQDGYVVRRPRIGTMVVSTDPAQPEAEQATLSIGLVITNFDDTFGTRVVEGILAAADGRANIVVRRTEGDLEREDGAIRSLVDSGVDGLLLLPSSSEFIPPAILELVTRRFPVVILDRRYEGIPVSGVATDNIAAGSEATEHLFSLGHRRIALITSDSRVTSNDDRRRGYVGAHARNDVTLDDALLFHDVDSTLPGSDVSPDEDIRRLTAFVSAHPDVTAYVAGEYNIALLLREALLALGRKVPADVSVVCFDHPDSTFDRRLFRFTHVAQDQPEIGRRSVEQLLAQIADSRVVGKVAVPATLVQGESTAPVG